MQKHKSFLSRQMLRNLKEFAHFLYHRAYGEETTHFVKKILTGEGVLRRVVNEEGKFTGHVNRSETGECSIESDMMHSPKLLRDKIGGKKIDKENRKKWLAYLIQAMNWYCIRVHHNRLRYRSTNRFPYLDVKAGP